MVIRKLFQTSNIATRPQQGYEALLLLMVNKLLLLSCALMVMATMTHLSHAILQLWLTAGSNGISALSSTVQ